MRHRNFQHHIELFFSAEIIFTSVAVARMEAEFPTSPAKRRRTMSPEEGQTEGQPAEAAARSEQPALETSNSMPMKDAEPEQPVVKAQDGAQPTASAGFLDVLMQQVEAESASTAAQAPAIHMPAEAEKREVEGDGSAMPEQIPQGQTDRPQDTVTESLLADGLPSEAYIKDSKETADGVRVEEPAPAINGEATEAPATLTEMSATSTQAQESTTMTGTEMAQPEPREWETDSDPLDSTDSDTSSDSSSSDDDSEDEGEYSLLDPEEQARILMQDDGGSDDEGKGNQKGPAVVRTANERVEEVIPKPDIEVTPEMRIEVLGAVEAIVESTVVVKANTTGEYQVLESGSLLCLADRSVIGIISETIGRVDQPMYTVRFTNDAAIEEAGLSQSGTVVYYVVPHSTFVFTQPLKGIKGSDASNFHDEEVGDDEMEFSDDEKEAEHKRQLKLRKQNRLGRDDGGRGGRGRGRGRGRGDHGGSSLRNMTPQSDSIDASNGTLNYDDHLEDGYTPLRRPSADSSQPPQPPPQFSPPAQSHRGDHRGRGRARGFRGRGRGFDNDHINRQQNFNQQMPPPQFPQFPTFPQQQTPHISPQTQFAPFSPSPISPLPGQQFNFGQFQNFQSPPMPPMQPYGPNTYVAGQGYGQALPQTQGTNNWPNAWPPANLNQTAMQQVQAHLEELNRMRGQGQNGQGR
jgi:H/ACA ribonucleoprotein complex non-core subunit NAF1